MAWTAKRNWVAGESVVLEDGRVVHVIGVKPDGRVLLRLPDRHVLSVDADVIDGGAVTVTSFTPHFSRVVAAKVPANSFAECPIQRARCFRIIDAWSAALPQGIVDEEIGDYAEDISRRIDRGQRWLPWVRVIAAIAWTAVNAAGYGISTLRYGKREKVKRS